MNAAHLTLKSFNFKPLSSVVSLTAYGFLKCSANTPDSWCELVSASLVFLLALMVCVSTAPPPLFYLHLFFNLYFTILYYKPLLFLFYFVLKCVIIAYK